MSARRLPVAILACWLAGSAASALGPTRVAVTLPPLLEMVERLGGDGVRVEVLLPPGAAPENWSPTPGQALAIARADLLVTIGHPDLSEEGLVGVASRAAAGKAILALAASLDRPPEAGSDPHLWMEPEVMARTASRLAEWLARREPGSREAIERRRDAYLSDLRAVDASLGERLEGARRPVVLQHPAWGRLLARHGVEVLVLEEEGKEPSPARLAALVRSAERLGVETIFTQIGVSDRAARLVAAEVGAEIVALDPLAGDWLDNLLRAGEAFARASR